MKSKGLQLIFVLRDFNFKFKLFRITIIHFILTEIVQVQSEFVLIF